MSEPLEKWGVQVRKGLLELCVLNALLTRERYGYELAKHLVSFPGLGVTEGTLYPLLSRLRTQGLIRSRLVESSEGPARKYYELTTAGRRMARAMNRHFDAIVEAVVEVRDEEEPHS